MSWSDPTRATVADLVAGNASLFDPLYGRETIEQHVLVPIRDGSGTDSTTQEVAFMFVSSGHWGSRWVVRGVHEPILRWERT